jgi:hypothetical protein
MRTGADLVEEVRDDLDEPVAQNWSDTKLLRWINKGIVRLVNATRAQRQHWFDRIILSTDSASTIRGETYTPTTSLLPTAGGSTLTLPPDCLEIVSLRPTSQTDLDNGLQLIQSRPTTSEWLTASRLAQNSDTGTYLYYTLGTRTLIVAPVFGASFNVRLQYVSMPDEITLVDEPSRVAEWMLDLAVLYAHYRALRAIKHDDYITARQEYVDEEKRLMGLNRPRESEGPVLVESAFDSWDDW